MHLKNKIIKSALVSLTIFFAVSCNHNQIKFDPDFYVANSATQEFVNENGVVIRCDEPRIEQGGFMTKEKIKELAGILIRNGVPESKVFTFTRGLHRQ